MNVNVEKILRKIPTEEKIFRNQRRVYVISAIQCIKALGELKMDSDQVKQGLQKLIDEYKLAKVKPKQNDPKQVDLTLSKTLNISDLYMWKDEEGGYLNIFIVLLAVAFIFFLAMFQIWPSWLKNLTGYSKYLIMGFLGFFIIAALVRMVVFCVTYFVCAPGIWLLPNLFEECGFFESFQPAYCWANENVSHKKEI